MDTSPTTPDTTTIGSHCHRIVRFTRGQIAEFARLTGDANPIHADAEAARRARHGHIIASGQQTAAQMIGLASTHCARGDDGSTRGVLCLNFNFSFKAPVFADEDVSMSWAVSQIEPSERLDGEIWHLEGRAAVGDRLCVVGRGTVLVKPAQEPAS